MYNTVQELITKADSGGIKISELARQNSAKQYDKTEDELMEEMRYTYEVMKQSVKNGLDKNMSSKSGLSGGMASAVMESVVAKRSLTDGFVAEVIYSALAAAEQNACMGKIVAAPTAGSCGIVPACLIGMEKYHRIDTDRIVESLFTAGAIGLVIAKNASISGAEGGCQAECGSAAAMAAAAMVELMGGTNQMSGHACAFALESVMGLVCDPVAGLVEVPCVLRNASCAMVAITAAELALSGTESVIPVDEVISAMKSVSQQMPPSLRETSEGGIAATATAKNIERSLFVDA